MKDFEDFHDKKVIFAGYFNLICESWICGGSPFLKRHSFSEIIKLNETFNLRDIWRVCNRHKKLLKFRQKHFTGFIQRRLDYIFVSNRLQESVKKTETLNALSSDHCPIFCFFVNNDTFARVSGVWKFNNSLLFNTDLVNDTHREKLFYSIQYKMAGWLLLTFLICLHRQLSSIIHSIITY